MIIYIPLIATIIAVIASFYASYMDLKKGIIPNKLTFPLIVVGLILNGVYAFMMGNIWIIITCAVVTAIIFCLGYLFWKMGAWAGGDVKLFTALAALLPFNPQIVSYQIFQVPFPMLGTWPFPFSIIINSILSILPFLLIYVFYVVIKTKPHLLDELISPIKKDYPKNFVLTLVITSAVTITYFITSQLKLQIVLIFLILIYLISLVISKLPNQVKAVLVSVVTVFALFYNFNVTVISIISLMITITIIEIIKKLLTSVSKEALQDEYPLPELREGMIPAYNMYQKDHEIFIDKETFFQKLKNAIKAGDVSQLTAPKGKLLVGTLAAGLTADDIKLLEKLKKEGRIPEKFRVKKGVPFAPSIFIGLIISIFIGDLAYMISRIISLLL